MPEAGQYASHLSHEAVAFVVGLSKKRQRFVLDLADQIARQPFQIGDYRTVDAAGRPVENLRLEGYLFRFGWITRVARCESARLSASEVSSGFNPAYAIHGYL